MLYQVDENLSGYWHPSHKKRFTRIYEPDFDGIRYGSHCRAHTTELHVDIGDVAIVETGTHGIKEFKILACENEKLLLQRTDSGFKSWYDGYAIKKVIRKII